MNPKPEFKTGWWIQFKRLVIARIALVAFLVAGVGFTVVAQSFYNLDFELATVTPPGPGQVPFSSALPGWTGYCGTNVLTSVNYNQEWLDTAGISIFDDNCTIEPVEGLTHGCYCVCLYSGFQGAPPFFEFDVPTSLAQTGWIPASASTILFRFSPSWSWGGALMNVTFNGISIPLSVVSGGGAGPSVLSGDVSQFAGQIGELRFTAPSHFVGHHSRNIFLMDYIQFPGTPPPPVAPTIVVSPQNQTAGVGSTVDFVVGATGRPPLAYQWFFDGTNAISGETSRGLRLEYVQLSQAGLYSVVITNAFGAVTSSPAILAVLDPFMVSQPRRYLVDAGATAWFSVVVGGTPPFSYQWLKNGLPLNEGVNISGAQTPTLTLSNVLCGDGDGYSVMITNRYGMLTSTVAYLTINWPAAYRVLHSFTGSDGGYPRGNLVSSGTMLYGTTDLGGTSNHGTVFKVTKNGSDYSILHSFALSDGADPEGGLVLSGATLYGTTSAGGISPDPGTVFKINTDGSGFTLLKEFTGSDGRWPSGGLVLSGTTLYGATIGGGSAGNGTVFKFNTDGSGYTVLHSFNGYPNDGYGPSGGLVLSGTTLYGATIRGGSYGPVTGWPDAGYGTLFKVYIDGSGYTILKQFSGNDGAGPMGGLVLSGATLYGTTQGGSHGFSPSTNYGDGTVYKINTDGSGYTVLHNFTGPPSDGAVPYWSLALSGTTLYGTTLGGGSYGYSPGTSYGDGTVFMINTGGGDYRVLKQFSGDVGRWSDAGLLAEGTTLYGTTSSGGLSNNGVVFALSLPVPNILMSPMSQTAEIGLSAFLRVRTACDPSLAYQWFCNGNAMAGCTNQFLCLSGVQATNVGAYSVVISNIFGVVTSSPAMLNVIPAVERRPVPGIHLTGEAGSLLNVDYASALSPAPSWLTLDTVNLTSTSQFYFDLSAPLPPQRFYRVWQTGTPSVVPSLNLIMVPAITLTGNVGDSLRVDCINQFGPTNAWVTLDTVTLTNKPQLYFDVSSPRQPPRLWRIVPEP